MSRYSIEGSTLTAIGDAIREKTGKLTKTEIFPVEQNTFVVPVYTEDIDVTQLSDKNSYGQVTQYWYYRQDIVIPGAVKFQVNYTFDTNLVDSYVVYSFKEDGTVDTSTSVFCNSSETTSGKIIKTYHNKVRIEVSINKAYWELKKYSYCDFEIIGLDVDENPVTEYEAEVINTITPIQMAEEVQNMSPPPPESAFHLTGNFHYRFANNGWNWFVEAYGDKVTTKDITSTRYMLSNSSCNLPFDINLADNTTDLDYTFNYYTGTTIPNIYGKLKGAGSAYSNVINIHYMFYSASNIKEIPNDFFLRIADREEWDKHKNYSLTQRRGSLFNGCSKLRNIPDITMLLTGQTSATGNLYYNLVDGCSALDEIVNIPVYESNITTNFFSNTFRSTYRLSRATLKTNEDGTPKIANWKSQTIDLSNLTGYGDYYTSASGMGLPNGKEVTDAATYEALKNDADWWTKNIDYSRYNHDSAVETINSLPDTSAYGANTIKFKGASGALTDGGAINTLTEEEIAVATAKGWTVSLV